MGWRDRDWGKFNDDEWNAFVGAGRTRYATTTTRGSEPWLAPSEPAGNWRPRAGAFLAVMVSLGVGLGLYSHRSTRHALAAPIRVAAPSNTIRIRWRTTDVSPAPASGRICVTDPVHGRLCAAYALGERPADALTRQLAALGLSVVSSG